MKQFLANKNITVLQHPPYSPDHAPCDFYLFPKIKSVLKGTHFVSVEHVKTKMTEILNSLMEHDLHNCFEHWQHRMQTQKGTILKAVIVDFLNFLNRKSYRHSLVFFVSDHIFSSEEYDIYFHLHAYWYHVSIHLAPEYSLYFRSILYFSEILIAAFLEVVSLKFSMCLYSHLSILDVPNCTACEFTASIKMFGAVWRLIIFTSMVNRLINASRNERVNLQVYDTCLQMFDVCTLHHTAHIKAIVHFLPYSDEQVRCDGLHSGGNSGLQ
jgi:hypothetical protein